MKSRSSQLRESSGANAILIGSGYSTGSGLLEKNFQKTDCVFHHC